MEKAGITISITWLLVIGALITLKWNDAVLLSLNEWGDFLAGITAPLAFLWLIIGYGLQRKELKANTEALIFQREELAKQAEELSVQSLHMAKQASAAADQASAAADQARIERRKYKRDMRAKRQEQLERTNSEND